MIYANKELPQINCHHFHFGEHALNSSNWDAQQDDMSRKWTEKIHAVSRDLTWPPWTSLRVLTSFRSSLTLLSKFMRYRCHPVSLQMSSSPFDGMGMVTYPHSLSICDDYG
ncbi:hypothetical protein TNCV_1500321 [Trichonephila clavipes]|nr:hypothetical protein TNCV_1500321 [Trichonephila clavipes]